MNNRTTEDAIKSANNTKYGLAAGIVTKNLDTANTVKPHSCRHCLNQLLFLHLGMTFHMEGIR